MEDALTAPRAGDFEALVEVLDPDVVFRFDRGGPPADAVTGAAAVARMVLAGGARFAPRARPAMLSGRSWRSRAATAR